MKKKVLCIFSLILYLLAACTMLSQKIEEEMRTQVELRPRIFTGYASPTSIVPWAMFSDDQGDHLYEVIEGDGWESGQRVQEVPDQIWNIAYYMGSAYLEITGLENHYFIKSASRQPPDGRLVQVVEPFEIVNDRYLAVYPGGIPESPELPEGVQIAARSGNTLLLDVAGAELPFMENKVMGLSDTLDAADRIISLTEVERFLEQLPSAAMVAPVLLMGLVLWASSCVLSIRAGENKWLILLNAAAAVASLCFLRSLLGSFDLPSSMLPSENILQLQHYSEELSLVFSTLEAFPGEAQSLVTTKTQMLSRCGEILRNGVLLSVAVVCAEGLILILRGRARRRGANGQA